MSVYVDPRTALTPPPPGRSRWRFTVHKRVFGQFQVNVPTWQNTILAELPDARGVRLEQKWDSAAQLVFTVDGRSPGGSLIQEMQHDIYAWRWSDARGGDVCMFRGPITLAEDQVTTDTHVVTFTAFDYLAMLERRFWTGLTPYVLNVDQDWIVTSILQTASSQQSQSSVPLTSYIPLAPAWANPDSSYRAAASGITRQRTYYGNATMLESLDALSKVLNGFDYDVQPAPEAGLGSAYGGNVPTGTDALRIFFPQQGVLRTDMALVYGSNVTALTRTLNSADYANYVREIGNNGSADPNAAQLARDTWLPEANATSPTVGAFMLGNNLPDIADATTLTQHAQGDLQLAGTLDPTYTLTLTPGSYVWGNPNMGDTVQLVVKSGRLNVNTVIRVLGIAYDVGEDNNENVQLTVGKPQPSLRTAFRRVNRDVSALTRR